MMMDMLRSKLFNAALGLVFATGLFAAPIATPPMAVAQPGSGTFVADDCAFDLPIGTYDGQKAPVENAYRIDCGWLTVPAQHSQPDGRTLQLAVAIIRSQADNVRPDPLFMLQGGPGGSSIDVFLQVLFPLGQEPSHLVADRDIVIFDQRGTLNSRPFLECREANELAIDTLDENLSREESDRLINQAYDACVQRLRDDGVDFGDFDSVENAADIEDLRVALGYDQINLYGVSYGTLLALHTMRDHPAGLRSVILDSVVPTQVNYVPDVLQSWQRSLDTFFEACRNEAACNRAYPDLENVFYNTVTELNANPVTLTIDERDPATRQATGRQVDALATGDVLLSMMVQTLYSTETIPLLPKMIMDMAEKRDSVLFRTYWSLLMYDATFASGMYHATMCAEEPGITDFEFKTDGVRPELTNSLLNDTTSTEHFCQVIQVPPLPTGVNEPVVSDIPTLVINGQLDPITPPAYGELAAQTLTQSFVLTRPNGGHGGGLSGVCMADIMTAFYTDPTRRPDTSCADTQPVGFKTPATMVMTEAPFAILSGTGTNEMIALGIAFIAALILVSVWLIWPVMALIGWMAKWGPSTPQTTREKLGRWAARVVVLLAGFLALGFLVAVVGIAFWSALYEGNNVIYGLPGWSAPIFAIPALLVLLTLAMIVGAIGSWRDRGWGVPGRLFYAFLTVVSVVFLISLVPLGWLWVWA